MVSNLYLKFSELQLLVGDDRPFGDIYGATFAAVLMEFLSPQKIIDSFEEELLAFLLRKSRNRISDISMTSELLRKAGSPYLRYYLGEVSNSVRKYILEYADFYARKFAEATKHQHKRALALTSRKLVRLVFELLVKNQLYTGEKLTSNQIQYKTNIRFLEKSYLRSIKVTLFSEKYFQKTLDISPECYY